MGGNNMGDIADTMIYGSACQLCGCFFDDEEEPGYPRTCNDCSGEDRKDGETFYN